MGTSFNTAILQQNVFLSFNPRINMFSDSKGDQPPKYEKYVFTEQT